MSLMQKNRVPSEKFSSEDNSGFDTPIFGRMREIKLGSRCWTMRPGIAPFRYSKNVARHVKAFRPTRC